MPVDVEIPGDRIYKTEMFINADIAGGAVIDCMDPKTGDTKVMLYIGSEELIKILEFVQENAELLKERKAKKNEQSRVGFDEPAVGIGQLP